MTTTADLETLRALAQLARLELDAEELQRFAPELGRILTAFEVLARHVPGASASSAAPANPPATASPAAPRTREDVPVPSLAREELLAAASESTDGFFAVPKTIGGER